MSTIWDWQATLLKHGSNAEARWALILTGYSYGHEHVYVSAERVAADYGCPAGTVRTNRTRLIKRGWLTPTGGWKLGQRVLIRTVPSDLPRVTMTTQAFHGETLDESTRLTRVIRDKEEVGTTQAFHGETPVRVSVDSSTAADLGSAAADTSAGSPSAADKPCPSRPADGPWEDAPVCPHGTMQLIPPGYDRKTGRPFDGYWVCAGYKLRKAS